MCSPDQLSAPERGHTVCQSIRLATRNGRNPDRLLRRALLHCSSALSRPSVASNIAKSGLSRVLKPFDNVNIYHAGNLRTTIVGFTRVATIFTFIFGTVAIAPMFVFDPTLTTWHTPLIVLGSAMPMLITTLATAPYVSNVRLVLPSYVRRTKPAVENFVKRVPSDTKIVLQTMRFMPWPMHREVLFNQLRRLPQSKWRSANIVVLPTAGQATETRSWLKQRLYQSYYIDRRQSVDRSALPGMLDVIWQQIPGVDVPPSTRRIATTSPLSQASRPRPIQPKHVGPR